MKKHIYLFVFLVAINSFSWGQTNTSPQKTILDCKSANPIADVLVDKTNNKIVIVYLKKEEITQVKAGRYIGLNIEKKQFEIQLGDNLIELDENENIIAIHNNKLLTQKTLKTSLIKELNIYDVSKQKLKNSSSLECDLQLEIKGLEDEGNIVVSDNYEGYGTTYIFYNSNLEELNRFKPYKEGFQMGSLFQSEHATFIVSRKNMNDDNVLFSVLNHNGILQKTSSLNLEGTNLGAIEVNDDFFLIYQYEIQSSNFKIGLYDFNLEKKWERNLDSLIIINNISVDMNSNSVIFESKFKLNCLNLANGNDKWNISKPDLLKNTSSIKFKFHNNVSCKTQVLPKINSIYFLFSNYSKEKENIQGALLVALNINNGSLQFIEELKKEYEFTSLKAAGNRILLINNREVISYETDI